MYLAKLHTIEYFYRYCSTLVFDILCDHSPLHYHPLLLWDIFVWFLNLLLLTFCCFDLNFLSLTFAHHKVCLFIQNCVLSQRVSKFIFGWICKMEKINTLTFPWPRTWNRGCRGLGMLHDLSEICVIVSKRHINRQLKKKNQRWSTAEMSSWIQLEN